MGCFGFYTYSLGGDTLKDMNEHVLKTMHILKNSSKSPKWATPTTQNK